MNALIHALAALVAAAAPPMVQAALPQYRLDAFAEAPDGFSYGSGSLQMNNAGVVAGTLSPDDSRGEYTFIYRNGRFERLDRLGGKYSSPVDLNERGEVVGNETRDDGSQLPFIYSHGRTRAIPLPVDAGPNARAVDINNLGHVLGLTGDGRAFVYDGNSTRYLDAGGLAFGKGAAFNDKGEVFSSYTYTDLDQVKSQPFLWREGRVTLLPELHDEGLGRFETLVTDATINNAGQVLFTVHGNNERYDNDTHGYFYGDGRYTRLGADQFEASDLNEKGWALGVEFEIAVDPTPNNLLLFRGGEIANLHDLLPPGSVGDFSLRWGYAIDDRGRVLFSGDRGLMIATPVPEPGAAALMLAGLLGVGAALRRRGPLTGEPA
ncbi:PEP-CTERM sorting domain-containing protein [Azohydromonas australica]|uniref:PEP-CTERM sorting domain-containing protein n=1 Tax=Azohydromonas australica TaxID=364039 RepID=UPI0003F51C26|nr:PEP-CTERM sorting domain-containing protein [Azohydromonas australica]